MSRSGYADGFDAGDFGEIPDAEEACTPRCNPGPVHSLDCPNYSGPLSRTGSLESAPHWSDTTGQTW